MLTTLFLQKNKMSPFNKKKFPLLLLALFIIVTTFSMNTEAATVYIYNYVTREDLKVAVYCNTDGGFLPTLVIAYGDNVDIVTDVKIACDFEWKGGRLNYTTLFDPASDTCNPCLYLLGPFELCFKYVGGSKCYKYN